MGMPTIKLWAKLANFLNTGDGKPWGNGFSATKVTPPQGLIDEGIRPEDPFRAEHENWYRNQVSKAVREIALQTVALSPRLGDMHSAMCARYTYVGGTGINKDHMSLWCGFQRSVNNSAVRVTPDAFAVTDENTSVGYADAYDMVLGGVNRSVSYTRDQSGGDSMDGIVYHAFGTRAFRSISHGFGPLLDSLTLNSNRRFGQGNACKVYTGYEIFPGFISTTNEGLYILRTGSTTWTSVSYTGLSTNSRQAMCTAHMAKAKKLGVTTPDVFAITQNQQAPGSKCCVVRIANAAGFAQTVLHDGAELYGANSNLWCAPVHDEESNSWIIVSTDMRDATPSNPKLDIRGFRVYRAGLTTPHQPTLVCDASVQGVAPIRLASLGRGFLLMAGLRRQNGFAVIELFVSPDSGETWHALGKSIGAFPTDVPLWNTVIGDQIALNQLWINATEDYDVNVGGGVWVYDGTAGSTSLDYTKGTHIVIPSSGWKYPQT